MLVDDLDLPTYVHSVLSRAGIERVSDLLGYTTKELMDIPGLGQKSLEEVRARLADKGWTLAGDELRRGRRRRRGPAWRRHRRATSPRRRCWAATCSTAGTFSDDE